jgi:hypothetical protein
VGRVDPHQIPRLEEVRTNLVDRLQEAKNQGWLGEVAAIETTMAAAAYKLETMRTQVVQQTLTHPGMPDLRSAPGRSSSNT